jgi:putative MFS transporter
MREGRRVLRDGRNSRLTWLDPRKTLTGNRKKIIIAVVLGDMLENFFATLAAQTGVYGVTLWAPTLFVLLLKVTPAQASKLMIGLTLGGLAGRISFALLSEKIGRRRGGGLLGFGAAILLVLAGVFHNDMLGAVSVFWLLLVAACFFADGGFAIVGPYAAEVWPAHLRTSGRGSAYGFGGLGKIIGPLGLALVVGSTNIVKPEASVENILPAFVYLAAWFAMAGAVYLFLGIETKGRSIEDSDRTLNEEATARGTL